MFFTLFFFFYLTTNYGSWFFFFFQAEDGIRDGHVTGVQTCALPISLVHGGLALLVLLQQGTFGGFDRARCNPWPPAGWFLGGPAGEVQVERSDDQQLAARAASLADRPTVLVVHQPEPFLPGHGHLRIQVERVDAGVVAFQVTPEQSAQGVGHVDRGGVVKVGGSLAEIVDEQPSDGRGLDAVLVDQFRGAALARHPHGVQFGRRVGWQYSDFAQQGVGQRSTVVPTALVFAQRGVELDAVADGDVADLAALVEQDPGDAVERVAVVVRVAPPGGLAVGPQTGEPGRVQVPAGFVQQVCGPVTQQPPVAGTDDLAEQQQYPAQQLGTHPRRHSIGSGAVLSG